MHYLPILVAVLVVLALVIIGLLAIRFARPSMAKIKEVMTPIEDQWTWKTIDGTVYEEVEVEKMEGTEILFRHKFGYGRIAVTQLTEDTRAMLDPKSHEIKPAPNQVAPIEDFGAAQASSGETKSASPSGLSTEPKKGLREAA